MFQAEVDKSGVLDRYIAKLGLTEEQVKKLKDTHVTFGDVAKGVWNTIADHTGADRGIEGFKNFAVSQFKQFLNDGVTIFANLYGDIIGTYRGIIVIWKNLPAAMGDVFYSAVNAAIGAINSLIQKSVGAVNSFIATANSVLGKFGLAIPSLTAPQIAAVANQYAGAGKTVANALHNEIAKATAEGKSAATALIRETERNIIGVTEKRISAQASANAADEKAAGAKGHHAAAARDLKKAIDDLAEAEKRAHEAALGQIESKQEEIEKLRLETQMIHASNRERAVMLAQLEAMQFNRKNKTATDDQAAVTQSYIAAANAAADLKDAQDAVAASTKAAEEAAKAQAEAFTQGLADMQAAAQQTANILSEAFGSVGDAIGKLITSQTEYNAISMKIAADEAAGKESTGLRRERAEARRGRPQHGGSRQLQVALQGAQRRLQGDGGGREGLRHHAGDQHDQVGCCRRGQDVRAAGRLGLPSSSGNDRRHGWARLQRRF